MIDETSNLLLPFILPSQAQKHVTHNEALRILDAVVHLALESRSASVPPADAQPGARYAVASGAGGAWTGKAGTIAVRTTNGWDLCMPRTGWLAWIVDEAVLAVRTQSAWVGLGGGGGIAEQLGINATADENNRLAVASPATLFRHDGTDHRLKIDKASIGDTASLIFQKASVGFAEIGLVGGNDLPIKISPDGASFTDAIVIDRATGKVSLPATPLPMPLGGVAASAGSQSITSGQHVVTRDWVFAEQSFGDIAYDNGVLTIGLQSAGRYVLNATVVINSPSASVALRIRRNGEQTLGHAQANGSGALFESASVGAAASLAAGDQITVDVWHNGSAVSINTVSVLSFARLPG